MLEATLHEHLERYAYLSPRRRMPGDETPKLREDSGTDD
jgi:hypothetical protein